MHIPEKKYIKQYESLDLKKLFVSTDLAIIPMLN